MLRGRECQRPTLRMRLRMRGKKRKGIPDSKCEYLLHDQSQCLWWQVKRLRAKANKEKPEEIYKKRTRGRDGGGAIAKIAKAFAGRVTVER
ncbi:hypothetical protein PV327_002637 [Microctonus hyperodae]|uniref:Uncharacterized protein n=1 Tax=Microctonus hyperodae TaxID=165561 RepID=A0AA39FGF9_MICHY|nr:hypothetical protein PV327_002637 [Microctonus hyperodae]